MRDRYIDTLLYEWEKRGCQNKRSLFCSRLSCHVSMDISEMKEKGICAVRRNNDQVSGHPFLFRHRKETLFILGQEPWSEFSPICARRSICVNKRKPKKNRPFLPFLGRQKARIRVFLPSPCKRKVLVLKTNYTTFLWCAKRKKRKPQIGDEDKSTLPA